MGPETALDGGAVEAGPLLIEEGFGPDHDPGGAESALQGAGSRKCPGQPVGSAGSKPSRVVTVRPATFSIESWQAIVAFPSSRIVQHPH